MQCVFCTDVTQAGDLLAEDEYSWIVRHPQGQWMVVAKRHVENVSDLDEDEWLHLARVWHRAERELREETNAARVMVMKLGIQTPHLHIHLFPFSANATRDEVFAAFEGR
jgi:diadenosine tetraphosphate (Ap4A) HIT family hydrolase